ncbi:MAG: hypothetical protein DMF63_01665 [Acidobacteria bacterium]|nr:MAG: hypothetical protein DMF63_01665 [Acidobacteriota bacterium]
MTISRVGSISYLLPIRRRNNAMTLAEHAAIKAPGMSVIRPTTLSRANGIIVTMLPNGKTE